MKDSGLRLTIESGPNFKRETEHHSSVEPAPPVEAHPGYRKVPQKFGDRAIGPRYRGCGCDLGQGDKNKTAFDQAGVGNFQGRGLKDTGTVKEQVQVDRARPPAFPAHPAELILRIQ